MRPYVVVVDFLPELFAPCLQEYKLVDALLKLYFDFRQISANITVETFSSTSKMVIVSHKHTVYIGLEAESEPILIAAEEEPEEIKSELPVEQFLQRNKI